MSLSAKQKKFCDEYLVDLNSTKAAERAGYSQKTAKEQASRLLTNVNVHSYLSSLKEKREKRTEISQDMIVNELAKVGFTNIQDYINGDLTIRDLAKIPANQAAAIKSIKRTVTESDFGTKEVVEFVLHDKLKSLELLGRHVGIFEKDNQQKAPVAFDASKLSDEAIKSILNASKNT